MTWGKLKLSQEISLFFISCSVPQHGVLRHLLWHFLETFQFSQARLDRLRWHATCSVAVTAHSVINQMSKTFIGDAVCREFESEVLTAEEMLDRVVCSRKQFSFRMCLESGDGSGTFHNWRQRVPDSWCGDIEFLGLKVGPSCHHHVCITLIFSDTNQTRKTGKTHTTSWHSADKNLWFLVISAVNNIISNNYRYYRFETTQLETVQGNSSTRNKKTFFQTKNCWSLEQATGQSRQKFLTQTRNTQWRWPDLAFKLQDLIFIIIIINQFVVVRLDWLAACE